MSPPAPWARLVGRALPGYGLIAGGAWWDTRWGAVLMTLGLVQSVLAMVRTHNEAVLACDGLWRMGIEAKQTEAAIRAANN